MDEDLKRKIETNTKFVEGMIKDLNDNPFFKEAQKAIKEQAEHMTRIKKEIEPYLENIKDFQNRNRYGVRNDLILESIKPKEHLILEEIKQIRSELKEIKDSKKSKVIRESYPLPENAKWNKLYIKFFDGHTVKVKYDDLPQKSFDYKDMGFLDRKTNNPDDKWKFLVCLAENRGRITNTKYIKKLNRNTKYEVCVRLKNFFNMKENPINNYTKEEGYLALFNISPEREDTYSFEDRHLIDQEI